MYYDGLDAYGSDGMAWHGIPRSVFGMSRS